jgi:hypothetical protein
MPCDCAVPVRKAQKNRGCKMRQKHKDELMPAAGLCGMVAALALLMTGCAGTMTGGIDAGCISYAEARLAMPGKSLPAGPWGGWVADTDDRMTGTCR